MMWTEQAREVVRSWTEAQKRLFEGWMETASAAGKGNGAPWSEWASNWQAAARQNLDAWLQQAGAVPRDVAGRLFNGEEVFLRFVGLVMEGLKNVAPRLEAGEDWVDLTRRYLDQLKGEMARAPADWASPEAAAALAKDLPQLWRLYLAEAEKLGSPWLNSLRQARGHLGEAMTGDRQATVKVFNLFMDTYEATLGKFAAAPAIGYTREWQEKVTCAFDAWVDLQKAQVAFHTEVLNTGFRALEAMLKALVEKGERGQKVTTLRQLFDLWVTSAEKAYFEVASTPRFAEVQGRLVNAAMRYRVCEREVAEGFFGAMHLPTRSELDDAYRHMHDLRGQVKALRRELAALRKQQEAAATPTPEAPARTRAAAPRKATAKPPRKPATRKAAEPAADKPAARRGAARKTRKEG